MDRIVGTIKQKCGRKQNRRNAKVQSEICGKVQLSGRHITSSLGIIRAVATIIIAHQDTQRLSPY
jgi:hypothetical protein